MAPSYSTDQVVNILSAWRNGFSAINQINFMMDAYEKSPNKDSELMKRVGLSVHYFRALTYYHLTKRYGNLPIMRSVSNNIVPISPEADVWAFIEEDLTKGHGHRLTGQIEMVRVARCRQGPGRQSGPVPRQKR